MFDLHLRRPMALLGILLCTLLLLNGCSTLPSDTPSLPSSDPSTSDTPSGTTVGGDNAHKPVTPALAYRAADTLHPYRCTSRVNRQLTPLLYEGLTAVDAHWDAQPALAAAWTATDATHIVVTLRDGAVFSDGTAVTPADVVSSFSLARDSNNYRELTANLAAVAAGTDARTVTVTLRSADPQYASSLSFPVVREQEDGCLGTGTYVFDAAKQALTANTHAAAAPAIAEWALRDVSRESEMAYALESRAITYYFTELSDAAPPRGVSTVSQTLVTRGDLLFLGINSARPPLSDASVRTALSQALSRSTLCATALNGYAVPATTPFVPTWSGASGLSGFAESENIASAVAKWQELGYNKLEVELLTCSDSALHTAVAAELVRQFAAGGVTATLVSLPTAEYTARLQAGRFDLYLGEIRLTANLSLRPLLQSGGTAAYGISAEARMLYSRYLSGELTAAAFSEAFATEAPFLPLCWRQGLGVYLPALTGVSPSGTNPYFGISAWALS